MIKRAVAATLLFTLLFGETFGFGINDDKKKSDEIKKAVWNSGDKDFAVNAIPAKWKNESAVIIARSFTLRYRKAPIVANLNFDNLSHIRIVLLDQKSLEQYAQFRLRGSSVGGGVRRDYYAGFKIVKPDGKEIEIPLSQAVKETSELNRQDAEYYKLAIPNLEIGDILDYYIAEERDISLGTKYFSFDPILHQLYDEYPIMKQKIKFEVLRRCFINAKSLNGAPEFEITQDDDKTVYYIEDGERERLKDTNWLFQNRDLPTIKFKVAYASGFVAAAIPAFLGEPGVLKSKVTNEEVGKFVGFVASNTMRTSIKSTMAKKFKSVKDQDKLAREAVYILRNQERMKYAENWLLNGQYANPDFGTYRSVFSLSDYYRKAKIPHEILIGIPRQVSNLKDLLLEDEIIVIIKVNTKKPFYVGRFDNNSFPGEIGDDLQGADVYSADGMTPPNLWLLKTVSVPTEPHTANNSGSDYKLSIKDLNAGTIAMKATKSSKGLSRVYEQNMFMDFYTYKDEEISRVDVIEPYQTKSSERKLEVKKEDYMSERTEAFNKTLKEMLEASFDLTVEEAGDLEILQTGRFEDKPTFNYSFNAEFKGAIKKAGPNYLLDIGKFLEKQIQIKAEDVEREHNIYMPYARSYSTTIEFEIPDGYTVEGYEKLNVNIENATGGFQSSAKVDGNKLIVEAKKSYKSNYEKKENWPLMLKFIQAAFDFTEKQVLLVKKR